jgi:glucose-1-phosphate adenylyltransferase
MEVPWEEASRYQNIPFIESYDPEYVIILSGDQICKQDYSDFLRFHKEKGAEFSVAVMEVPWEEASRFGLMVADENDKITEFQEKPKQPKSNLASMGIYIFNWDILKKYLIEDEADPNSSNDFGKNIIPKMLGDGQRMFAFPFRWTKKAFTILHLSTCCATTRAGSARRCSLPFCWCAPGSA